MRPADELEPVAPVFRARLLAWYDQHARDLPWRRDKDPYRVWVSEIMLQQTRVAAVIEHYHRFLQRFPTVEKLAAAREASVLAAWSGLGYYRRARMMHTAAKAMARGGGRFPTTAAAWRELRGIGRYTAAAIASIAFAEPVAVVDGNVERVLQRISGMQLAGEELWRAAERLLDCGNPGDFNQAMMELGATVCTPRAPACLMCPVVELCATRGEMHGKARAPRQSKREIHCVLACRSRQNSHRDKRSPISGGSDVSGRGGGELFLVQRPRSAQLMPGMWELPEIQRPANQGNPALIVRHSITVTDYTVRVWNRAAPLGVSGRWIAASRLPKLPLTGLTRKILTKISLI